MLGYSILIYEHIFIYTDTMHITAQHTTKAIVALKILSDTTRLRILALLYRAPDGMCVYEIADAIGISHSAASHQLTKLEAHGVLESFRDGQNICYEICRSELSDSIQRIMNVINA